jgi:hypothetical protein
MGKKTDNHDPRAKLDLRRYFLRKYHADDPPRVLDCCQGGGVLWGTLRQEFSLASYWGLDLKPKKGRLELDSIRVLAQPGWTENVIDIDTYGSPWKHWVALLPNVQLPATVFLTIATKDGSSFDGGDSREVMNALNLPSQTPKYLRDKIGNIHGTACALHVAGRYGIMLCDAVEAVSNGNARYIGVRLEKSQAGAVTPT